MLSQISWMGTCETSPPVEVLSCQKLEASLHLQTAHSSMRSFQSESRSMTHSFPSGDRSVPMQYKQNNRIREAADTSIRAENNFPPGFSHFSAEVPPPNYYRQNQPPSEDHLSHLNQTPLDQPIGHFVPRTGAESSLYQHQGQLAPDSAVFSQQSHAIPGQSVYGDSHLSVDAPPFCHQVQSPEQPAYHHSHHSNDPPPYHQNQPSVEAMLYQHQNQLPVPMEAALYQRQTETTVYHQPNQHAPDTLLYHQNQPPVEATMYHHQNQRPADTHMFHSRNQSVADVPIYQNQSSAESTLYHNQRRAEAPVYHPNQPATEGTVYQNQSSLDSALYHHHNPPVAGTPHYLHQGHSASSQAPIFFHQGQTSSEVPFYRYQSQAGAPHYRQNQSSAAYFHLQNQGGTEVQYHHQNQPASEASFNLAPNQTHLESHLQNPTSLDAPFYSHQNQNAVDHQLMQQNHSATETQVFSYQNQAVRDAKLSQRNHSAAEVPMFQYQNQIAQDAQLSQMNQAAVDLSAIPMVNFQNQAAREAQLRQQKNCRTEVPLFHFQNQIAQDLPFRQQSGSGAGAEAPLFHYQNQTAREAQIHQQNIVKSSVFQFQNQASEENQLQNLNMIRPPLKLTQQTAEGTDFKFYSHKTAASVIRPPNMSEYDRSQNVNTNGAEQSFKENKKGIFHQDFDGAEPFITKRSNTSDERLSCIKNEPGSNLSTSEVASTGSMKNTITKSSGSQNNEIELQDSLQLNDHKKITSEIKNKFTNESMIVSVHYCYDTKPLTGPLENKEVFKSNTDVNLPMLEQNCPHDLIAIDSNVSSEFMAAVTKNIIHCKIATDDSISPINEADDNSYVPTAESPNTLMDLPAAEENILTESFGASEIMSLCLLSVKDGSSSFCLYPPRPQSSCSSECIPQNQCPTEAGGEGARNEPSEKDKEQQSGGCAFNNNTQQEAVVVSSNTHLLPRPPDILSTLPINAEDDDDQSIQVVSCQPSPQYGSTLTSASLQRKPPSSKQAPNENSHSSPILGLPVDGCEEADVVVSTLASSSLYPTPPASPPLLTPPCVTPPPPTPPPSTQPAVSTASTPPPCSTPSTPRSSTPPFSSPLSSSPSSPYMTSTHPAGQLCELKESSVQCLRPIAFSQLPETRAPEVQPSASWSQEVVQKSGSKACPERGEGFEVNAQTLVNAPSKTQSQHVSLQVESELCIETLPHAIVQIQSQPLMAVQIHHQIHAMPVEACKDLELSSLKVEDQEQDLNLSERSSNLIQLESSNEMLQYLGQRENSTPLFPQKAAIIGLPIENGEASPPEHATMSSSEVANVTLACATTDSDPDASLEPAQQDEAVSARPINQQQGLPPIHTHGFHTPRPRRLKL